MTVTRVYIASPEGANGRNVVALRHAQRIDFQSTRPWCSALLCPTMTNSP